jgi:2,3-bisphosphoglycerate-dependent phosphoglycerate mutase
LPAPGWKRDPHHRLPLPGAESLLQAGQRVARHVRARMRERADDAEGKTGSTLTLFVAHGGAFRHAASELGLLSSADVQRLTMQHAAPIFFEFHSDGDASRERWLRVAGDWLDRSPSAPVD